MDRLRAMRIFCSIVEAGSFTRAARVMNLSNAAVSESLRNLEGSLGVVLVKRTSRHLSLTDEGQDYYHRSVGILDEVARAESDARSGAVSVDGNIRVEATIAVGEMVIGPERLEPVTSP